MANETLSGCCDLSKDIEEKKKLVNEFCSNEDYWIYFEEFCQTNNIAEECFYLKFINSDLKDKEVCKELFNNISNNDKKKDGMISQLVTELSDSKNKPETYYGTFQRAKKLKEFFKDFLEKNKLENDEKLIVFTHSAFIRVSTSKLAYEMTDFRDYPSDAIKIDNCEMLSILL